jgi:predicted nuclease of predicted toxin-antitoxin system
MLLLAADENFNNDIVRGLLRQEPSLDIVRIQDVGLSGANDPTILEWAAQEDRALLTHDVSTITHYAYERIRPGKLMAGIFEVSRDVLSELPSRIFSCWRNVVWMRSGKIKFYICLCYKEGLSIRFSF